VLHDFWVKLRRDVAERRLAEAVQTVLGAYKLPAHLPPDLLDDLPDGPGVYRFFGDDDVLLYVGRSNSLRARVCSHFAAKGTDFKDRRFADQVRRVDWAETAGELGAMLREAEWIRTHKPLYNRRTKTDMQPHTLRGGISQTPAGQAFRTLAVPIDGVDCANLMQCFGVFHSERDARKAQIDIARAHRLCLKVMGLEDGAGSCLAYQVGKCRGACLGKEPLILHNTRLQLALSSLKLKSWPFPGRVALRERDPRGWMPEHMQGTDLHVVDHWTYLGTARTEEELADLGSRESGAAFDVDVYRILVRYFTKHPKLDWLDLRRSERPVA
jgi:DNA polymerase-3 subunit epsilon